MSKYGLDKQEIETLKRAIAILDDINCDEYADNIREILEREGVKDTDYVPTEIQFKRNETKTTYEYQQTDEGYKDG